MSSDNETTEGGSTIMRHEARDESWTPPAEGIDGAMECITAHLEGIYGEVGMVFHEIMSDTVHLDVHHIPPSASHPYHILFTTGMSDLPMSIPDGIDVERRAELMIALPEHWKMSQDDWKDERWYWPIRAMKTLARLPHEYDTWLTHAHTLPNGDPAEAYAEGVPFTCAMIVPPLLLPPDDHVIELPNGESLRFLSVLWLHPGEMDLKLEKGSDELYDRLDTIDCSELVDLERPDVSRRRKKLFGLF